VSNQDVDVDDGGDIAEGYEDGGFGPGGDTVADMRSVELAAGTSRAPASTKEANAAAAVAADSERSGGEQGIEQGEALATATPLRRHLPHPLLPPPPPEGLAALGALLAAFVGTRARWGFVGCCVALAAGTSVVEKLVFLFFTEDLGASLFLCGVSVLVTVVFEVPIFAYGTPLLERLGSPALLGLAALAYVTRVVGYTLVPSPWLLLALEPLHGVTFSCFKMAKVQYVAAATPPGLEASGQILMGSVTSLGGSLVGAMAGGWVEQRFGARALYRGAAAVIGGAFAAYGAVLSCDAT
jgi:hypothetical protein